MSLVTSSWINLSILSGVCAATNSLFAKLTTTELTGHIASAIGALLGVGENNRIVEVLVRGVFFALNLGFNGIMWGLFTAALTKGSSATQVSIVNTSANFLVTAIMGWWIFSEALPLMWWAGAALLVTGNVIIGRKDNEEKKVCAASYQSVARQDEDDDEADELRMMENSSSGEEEEGGEEEEIGGSERESNRSERN